MKFLQVKLKPLLHASNKLFFKSEHYKKAIKGKFFLKKYKIRANNFLKNNSKTNN